MTRSITIVNTSNWPNEDYVVTAGSYGPQRSEAGRIDAGDGAAYSGY